MRHLKKKHGACLLMGKKNSREFLQFDERKLWFSVLFSVLPAVKLNIFNKLFDPMMAFFTEYSHQLKPFSCTRRAL